VAQSPILPGGQDQLLQPTSIELPLLIVFIAFGI
jgi:hypothetical protein